MVDLDIKAGMNAFAKVTRWFARSKRMLLIVSPFLAIVAVLVWLAIISMDILAAGRAYVEGESLWSKNQKEAVFHLVRFATTGSESDFLSYQKAIMVPMGFRKARVELEKTYPDNATVQAGFLAASGLDDHTTRGKRLEDSGRELRRLAEIGITACNHIRKVDRLLERQFPGEQADECLRIVGEDRGTAG